MTQPKPSEPGEQQVLVHFLADKHSLATLKRIAQEKGLTPEAYMSDVLTLFCKGVRHPARRGRA